MGFPLRSMAPSAMMMMFRRDPRLRVWVRDTAGLSRQPADTCPSHGCDLQARPGVHAAGQLPLLGVETGGLEDSSSPSPSPD